MKEARTSLDSTAPETKSPSAERRFKYVRDPLFLACVAVYAVNRFFIKPLAPGHLAFFHWHLNDLICIPFWLPPVLWVNRRIGIRRHDGTPTFGEIFLHLALWSAFFEIAAPRMAMFQGMPVGDPADVLFYALGALAGAVFWGLRGARAGASVRAFVAVAAVFLAAGGAG